MPSCHTRTATPVEYDEHVYCLLRESLAEMRTEAAPEENLVYHGAGIDVWVECSVGSVVRWEMNAL